MYELQWNMGKLVGARPIRQLSGAPVDPVSAYRRFPVLNDMSCAAIVNSFEKR